MALKQCIEPVPSQTIFRAVTASPDLGNTRATPLAPAAGASTTPGAAAAAVAIAPPQCEGTVGVGGSGGGSARGRGRARGGGIGARVREEGMRVGRRAGGGSAAA